MISIDSEGMRKNSMMFILKLIGSLPIKVEKLFWTCHREINMEMIFHRVALSVFASWSGANAEWEQQQRYQLRKIAN